MGGDASGSFVARARVLCCCVWSPDESIELVVWRSAGLGA